MEELKVVRLQVAKVPTCEEDARPHRPRIWCCVGQRWLRRPSTRLQRPEAEVKPKATRIAGTRLMAVAELGLGLRLGFKSI